MKELLKVIICFLAVFGIIVFLRKIGQYNFVSFMAGMIWMGLWLLLCDYLDD